MIPVTRPRLRALTAVAAAILIPSPVPQAAPITIDFESIPDATPSAAYNVGDIVPTTARLSTQLLGTHGVRFASLHQPYVGLLEIGLGHAASGKNSIGAVGLSNAVNFSDEIVVSFFDPLDGTTQAVTDFVSIRCDNTPTSPGPLRLEAYGVAGTLLSSDSQTDGAGVLLSVSTPNIHYVRVTGDGSSAFDDLSFNTAVAVPEPMTSAMALVGLACVGCQTWHRRKLALRIAAACAVVASTFTLVVSAYAVPIIDWVTVDDPGNAADTTGYGAVADTFQIQKYEFTNQQYADFLNSVAATDTYALYNANMGSDARGGISRSGEAGSFSYAVKPSMGNKPVNYVSWFDAARVANWLMNGATGTSSTETGAYTLVGGQTSGVARAVNSGATFFIPTEDQWYKTAYYNGVTGQYAIYGNGFSTAPAAVSANSVGDGSAGATGNFANFDVAATWNASVGNVTTVGTNGGPSFYGAFDMSGNLWETNDLTGAAGSSRGRRGGVWHDQASYLSSSGRLTAPTSLEGDGDGFRLASPLAVPEPSTFAMALAGLACGGWLMRRHRRG
jgi:formylglycine-generating enzyme required for sulfatase activity